MTPRQGGFVLAVSASPRGFAFVVFHGPTTPFDWGVKEFRGKHKSALTLLAIKKLIREYRPERLVIEEAGKGSRRGVRIRALYRDLNVLARREQIPVSRLTNEQVLATFANENARTRPEIAQAIAARLPVFAPKLPPERKIWMSEDPRQSLFDAAALGITFFFNRAAGSRGEPVGR
jgi:hypothetical protein